MLDNAQISMSRGALVAAERAEGVNDNMSQSHFHDYYELYYLESGERYHMVDGEIFLLHKGEFFIFPPNRLHHSYGEKDVPFRRICIYFRPSAFLSAEIRQCFSGRKSQVFSTAHQADRFQIHRLLEMLLEETEIKESASSVPSCSEDYLLSVLNLLLITIIRKSYFPKMELEKTTMAKVVRYLQEHSAEDISIERLAAHFYISPYYLCREFKKATGSTIIQYLNDVRVILAKNMFLETSKNVTEVSNAIGFSNLTHFNRVFKSVTGFTPSAYRKTCHEQAKNVWTAQEHMK